MGTAPEIWNGVMGLMVDVVPREWWRSRAFSEGLARFSKPLVQVTDAFVGETHAMRVDATADDGSRASAVQAHRSFREVVGQSCAEFTAALLESRGLLERAGDGDGPAVKLPESAGVFLPEQLLADEEARRTVLERLLSVEGTVDYEYQVVSPR